MQKKTIKCEPSTEILYVWGGVLKDDVNMDLFLDGVTINKVFFFVGVSLSVLIAWDKNKGRIVIPVAMS